jgi:hypothetical protein
MPGFRSLFNGAQSFYLNSSIVSNSDTIDLTGIGMYFMYRPQSTNNKSGIDYPGVSLFLTDVINGVPNMANVQLFTNIARAEWNSIYTSSDASVETIFRFTDPVTLQTGKAYAFCWSYDGGEDFLPWTNIKGNHLVGNTTASPGPSQTYGGNYFTAASITSNSATASPTNYQQDFTPLAGTDAKFSLYAARYAVNSVPVFANLSSLPIDTVVYSSNLLISYVGNGQVQITSPSPRMEYIAFDIERSVKQSYIGAQQVYQNTVSWPGGGVYATVSTTGANTVTANANLSNGAPFSWSNVFGAYTGDKYVVIDYGSNTVDVRKVTGIISNTVIAVDEQTTVVNSAAKIMVSPVAVTDSFNTSFINGKKASLMFMRDSNANASVRFVGHSVDFSNTLLLSAGGTGYSNSDRLFVYGYQNVNGAITMNYPAVANLVTNATGGVTALNFSNVGAGFSNSAAAYIVVANGSATVTNTSANSSAGSGLSMNLVFGTYLKTEHTSNLLANARPVNIDVHTAFAAMTVQNASNTVSYAQFSTQYYLANNALTANGYITYVGAPQVIGMELNSTVMLNQLPNIPVVASRSLEFTTLYSNGATNDKVNSLTPYSNSFLVQITTSSNNDWKALGPIQSPLIDLGRYIVNNDYTGENTDSGNALARHVTTVFNMTGPANTNYMAEDLRAWISAWRPPGTDIQLYARIQNSTDSAPFTSEDWTRLTILPGSNNFSSSSYVDLAFGFQGQPNTTTTLATTVTTANGSSNVTSSNTTAFTGLTANTLVKIYDPLFANNNFAVGLITAVPNSSVITIDQVFSTNTVTGIGGFALTGRGGLGIDVLNFGHQAFNNVQNDNVVRYYSTSENTYDGFNIVQLKAIMLTNDAHNIPRIHNVRGIGVSA